MAAVMAETTDMTSVGMKAGKLADELAGRMVEILVAEMAEPKAAEMVEMMGVNLVAKLADL